MKASEVNNIIFFTHSIHCSDLILDIIVLFKKNSVNSHLVIVDLYNNTITQFNTNNEDIKLINSKKDVDKLVHDCGVSSYPRFCVHRNGTCVESISGNYENIKTILNYYL